MVVLLVKTTLILLVGAFVTVCMRKASAASRHVVLTATLVGALLLPVARVVMPALELRLLPAVTVPVAGYVTPWQPAISAAASGDTSARPARAISMAPDAGDPAGAIPWLSLLAASGVIVLLVRAVTNQRARRRVWADAVACPDSRMMWATDRVRGLLGLTRPVSTRLARPRTMPATFGAVSPKLLLPRDAADWSDERLDAVLTHELAHVRRFDDVSHAIARAAAALYWYHPLAWWLARQARLERERACDDAVLRLGMRPSTYAEHLLALREALPLGADVALTMARRAQMAQRLRAILDPKQRRNTYSRVSAATAAIIIAASAIVGAALFTAPVIYRSQTQLLPIASIDTVLPQTPAKISAKATWAGQRPVDVSQFVGDVTPEVTPKDSTPSQPGFSGTWEPVPSQGEQLVTLFEVGIAPVRGRFTVTHTTDAVAVAQTLPDEIARTYFQITGRDAGRHVYSSSEWSSTFRLDGDELVAQFGAATPIHFRRAQSRGAVAQTAPQPIPPGNFGAGAYRPGSGVSNPIRLREVKPVYTREAERAGVQGTVELEAVVGADGAVTDVRVVRSLDAAMGLDVNALEAVRTTPFVPCKIKDQPVPCLVVFELQYKLDPPAEIPAGQFGAGAYLFRQAAGMEAPVRIRDVRPQYTPDAMRAKIQGVVTLEFVINADGTVGDVRVYRSLDTVFGLDEQAIKAIKAMRWQPGTFKGAPVAMVAVSDITFTLR